MAKTEEQKQAGLIIDIIIVCLAFLIAFIFNLSYQNTAIVCVGVVIGSFIIDKIKENGKE